MIVTTLAGQRLELACDPFNDEGSEGRLFDIQGKPGYVAKIFRTSELARKREPKLKAMCRLPQMCSLPPNLTWPQNLLYDENGVFVGFIMKRLQPSVTFDKLFAYPNGTAQVSQRLAALISLANTLGRMHMCGVAMGDPGPQNIPVLADCTVQLIDTDSFDITMPDGSRYPCLGCTPEYVAPEMLRAAQGGSYATCGVSFDAWTDCYALGVLVHKALFFGKHPCSYAVDVNAPDGTPVPPLVERERNGWVSAFVPRPNLCVPAGMPAMSDFPPYLQEAFRRTFVEGFRDPHRRTTAFEWQQVLTRYFGELVDCPEDERHAHWKGAATCPYCAAEERNHDLMNRLRVQAGMPPLAAPKRKSGGRRARKGARRGGAATGGASGGGASVGGSAGAKAAPVASGAAGGSRGASGASTVGVGAHGAATASVAASTLNVAARGGSGALSAAAAAGKGRGLQTRAINAFNRVPVRWARWFCVAASYLTIYFVQPTSVFQNFVCFCVGMCSDVEFLVTGLAGFIAGWKTAKSDARTNKPIAYRFFDAVAATLIAMVVAALVGGVLCLLIGDTAPFGGLFRSTYEYQSAARAMGLGR